MSALAKWGGLVKFFALFFPTLLELHHIDMQRNVAFQMMEYTADPDTWNYILDNCLIRSKLGGWIEADCKMEHLVRTQKDSYTAHGGSFRWDNMNEHTSLLSTLMYETKLVFANSLREEKIKGKHYNPSMEKGILNVK
ncbi:hypothetical protein V8E54_010661 [Elaphomyces granulatus]